MKKTLLLVIDALASAVIRPALEGGGLPNMARLVRSGSVRWNSTAIFPSITPAATSSICTGRYPTEHGILGVCYYDREQDRVHYYGTDIFVILREGLTKFFHDVLVQLNRHQLATETLFQLAERSGRTSASVNYLLFHGDHTHDASTPWLLRLLPGMPNIQSLAGPSVLCIGDFASQRKDLSPTRDLQSLGGVARRFGFCDENTMDLVLQLAAQGMPDLTVAYFPDNDFDSHERGPLEALETVQTWDRWLGELAAQWGGFDQMLEELAIFVTGDHSQSNVVADPAQAGIELGAVLDGFRIARTGSVWDEEDQIMICPNLRAAMLYVRELSDADQVQLVERILTDARVDQVFWYEQDLSDEPSKFHVATSDRGCCSFWRTGQDASVVDHYGQRWILQGDPAAIDAHVDDSNNVTCPQYPNALERIAKAFDPHRSGDLWVTARVGYEFADPGGEIHNGGGSHGSLHLEDSQSPLIAAGLPDQLALPEFPRSVDIVPLCLRCLGVESQLAMSQGHVPLK